MREFQQVPVLWAALAEKSSLDSSVFWKTVGACGNLEQAAGHLIGLHEEVLLDEVEQAALLGARSASRQSGFSPF